ncbi:MAG TPA: hypothetical protein VGS19_24055 [Streptosporangiaceae bacterium]|nr:hypothetical protein [Streptosporangiaceae bacterium]
MSVHVYERTITRMTIDPDRPVPPQMPEVIAHLPDPDDATRALCDHQPGLGDIPEPAGISDYADWSSRLCRECERLSQEQAEEQ